VFFACNFSSSILFFGLAMQVRVQLRKTRFFPLKALCADLNRCLYRVTVHYKAANMSESGDKQLAAEMMVPDETPLNEAVEIPKERIKRPSRPDDAAHKQKTEALQSVSKFYCDGSSPEHDCPRAVSIEIPCAGCTYFRS
jgi:hypothetical protein